MVDCATVLIAAISAGAGLAGSFIAGHFSLKALSMGHRKDDVVSLRVKVEELYAELDHIQNLSNSTMALAAPALKAHAAPQEKFDVINLGKIRSIVGLYFPSCQTAIDAFDKQEVEDAKALRAKIEDDPVTASFSFILIQCAHISKMCREMRDLLGKEAKAIGISVRGAPVVPPPA